MLAFKFHNQSSTPYSPLNISYSVYSSASLGSIVCVVPRTGAITGYDLGNNRCSFGADPLGAHQTDKSAILVNVNSDPPNLTFTACAGATPTAKTFCNTQVVVLND